jgi:hypothetical protein
VRAERHQVDAELAHIDGQLAGGLNSIRVEGDAALAAQRRQRCKGLHRPDLVVGIQDGDDGHLR